MSRAEAPILFSTPMVAALLAGWKTETRRAVRVPEGLDAVRRGVGVWVAYNSQGNAQEYIRCPYVGPGTELWVRETWANIGERGAPAYVYRASTPGGERVRVDAPWRPSIFMPRAASRITLHVVEVRAERLHEITPEAILAEGISDDRWSRQTIAERGITDEIAAGLRACWEHGWNEINGRRAPWAANPWVWVVRFEREVTDGR